MDLDLDNDFVFDNDRIRNFLQDKLQEIQFSNKKLQEMIQKRKHMFSNITEASTEHLEDFKMSFCWKKLFNGKCAFGYEVQNHSNINLKLCKVFLKWNSCVPLNFNTHVITEKEFNCIEKLTRISDSSTMGTDITGYIVIVINLPQFLDKLTLTITGNLFYKQNKIDVILDLPNVEITSSDVTEKKLNTLSLEIGSAPDLLTVIFCSLKTDFIMILPEGTTTSLNSIFEIHCFLTSVNLPNSFKKYFAAYRICPTFDNSLLEIHTSCQKSMFTVTIYTKNDESLIAFVHYLHQNIQGVIIIPKLCPESYNIQQMFGKFDNDSEIVKFKLLIEKEIENVQNYMSYLESARKDCDVCMHLRKKILDAEKNTDISYLGIISNS